MDHQDEILEIFRSDAKDHLSVLNSFLLEVEKAPQNLQNQDEVLRAVHTLKGDSRMVGLEEIGNITHKIEDVLKGFKTGRIIPQEKNLSILFRAAELLEKMVFGQKFPPESLPELTKKLESLLAPPSTRLFQKLTSVLESPVKATSAPAPAPTPTADSNASVEKEKTEEPKEVEAPEKNPIPKEGALKPSTEKKSPPQEKQSSEKNQTDKKDASGSKSGVDTLRIRSDFLDSMLNLLGELTINREKITSIYHRMKNIILPLLQIEEGPFSEQQKRNLKNLLEDFYENTGDYYHLTTELQGYAIEVRMLPVGTILQEYPVMVRNMATELGKKCELEIHGKDTQLDKNLLEAIRPALTHLVRNSIDHGIETPEERIALGKPAQGRIILKAYPQGNNVFIEIEDDGKGINPERIKQSALQKGLMSAEEIANLKREDALNLIFIPGFSTKTMVTSISGRGIGMDVVAHTVERLKGHVSIDSQEGQYTRFSLQLPMTLTIMQALLVVCHREIVAIPLSFIQETQIIHNSQIRMEGGTSMINLRGNFIPLLHLSKILQFPNPSEKKDKYKVAILKFKEELLGVIVDKFLREQEVVIKGVGVSEGLALISGATILRKGDPAIILNVYDVFQRLRYNLLRGETLHLVSEGKAPEILVVDDSITVRTVQKNVLEKAGYRIETASSAEEALEKTLHKVYNLVVTDVEMDLMDGFELTRQLRSDPRYHDIPIIIVTSLSKEEDRKKGMDAGAQAYIAKSAYDQKVLLEKIKTLIGAP